MKKAIMTILFCTLSNAICIHEQQLPGHMLSNLLEEPNYRRSIYIHQGQGKYKEASNWNSFNPQQIYTIQVPVKNKPKKREYNDKYLTYYRYENMTNYLAQVSPALKELQYEIRSVGKSLKGRDLFSIYPLKFDPSKKVVLMFGRHHGDEGTANWIIEGFIDFILKDPAFLEKFQLVLYPMVNPDGAQKMSRYNSKGRDLNRSWGKDAGNSFDEVKTIHRHIEELLLTKNKLPIIMLDMHGSYTKDFIYRVDKRFRGISFFNIQQSFIDELGSRDTWQSGSGEVSNGHKKMARIMMVRDYGINALTHETPRDIKIKSKRSLSDLKSQGVDIANSLLSLY